MAAEQKGIGGGGATEWLIPVAAVTLVFVMLVPVPAIFLDILLALSITSAFWCFSRPSTF